MDLNKARKPFLTPERLADAAGVGVQNCIGLCCIPVVAVFCLKPALPRAVSDWGSGCPCP